MRQMMRYFYWILILLLSLLVAGCDHVAAPQPQQQQPRLPTTTQPIQPAATVSVRVAPIRGQLCPAWVHDSYTVMGPDGRMYPTWHPAVDEQYGCTLDHEHGDDPRTSVLFSQVGMPPFGYVNAIEGKRTEDHVGNKVFVINDDDRGGSLLIKLHQGTHSPDAFTNNLHELHYHYQNVDGRRLDIMLLSAFGRSGELTVSCGATDRQVVNIRSATNEYGSADSARIIPSAACFDNTHPVYEDWLSNNQIITPDQRIIALFNPHFAVFDPGRYFLPGAPQNLGRSVDRCREIGIPKQQACLFLHSHPEVQWNDSQSPFRGNKREVFVNQNIILNSDGPQLWYSDPYGRNAQTKPFPGAIQQRIAAVRFTTIEPAVILGTENIHNGPSVRSPN